MLDTIKKYSTAISKKLGLGRRGCPRLYFKGGVDKYGFTPGTRYNAKITGSTLTLTVCPDGKRLVSRREIGDKFIPIIDIESHTLLSMFDGHERVRVIYQDGAIHILPLATVVKVKERLSRLRDNLTNGFVRSGSLATGIGIMALALHLGLGGQGIRTDMAFACELREELLDHAVQFNPAISQDTLAIVAPLQEATNDDWLMAHLPKVDILEMSLPCSGASSAGRAKNKTSCAEEHPDVGHLIASALQVLAKVNPSIIIFENVPPYALSASGHILRYQLRDMGYAVHETELVGEDFNSLENRKRWCVVGVTNGIPFDFAALKKPMRMVRQLREVLEEIPSSDPRWSEMRGLKEKEIRDKEAGKGFMMQVFTPGDTYIGTLTKGYAKVRSTDPKIRHPENPELLRQLTPVEHARIKGVPESLISGMCQTLAHEVLGQSVLVTPFKAVGELVGDCLQQWLSGDSVDTVFTLARAAA